MPEIEEALDCLHGNFRIGFDSTSRREAVEMLGLFYLNKFFDVMATKGTL